MKRLGKLLLVVALLIVPMGEASARFYAGGHIGLRNSSDGMYLRIAPEIGWQFNNNLMVGGQMSFATNTSDYSFVPYLRWSFLSDNNNIRAFLSCTAPIRRIGTQSTLGLILRPGISVRVSNNLWIAAQAGNFGYRWYLNSPNRGGEWLATLNTDTVSIGFLVDF